MNRITLAVLVGFTLGVAPGYAQNPNAPGDGDWGVSFLLPAGGGTGFGLRWLAGSRTNIGFDVTGGFSWSEVETPAAPEGFSRSDLGIGVRPNMRLYSSRRGPVLPFLSLGLEARYVRDYEDDVRDPWTFDFGGDVGIGVEWFPLSKMSLSGQTGVAGRYFRSERVDISSRGFTVQAFRSELSLNLYF